MSTSTYGEELRKRVIENLREGLSQAGATKIFKISSSTVSRWWQSYQEEGRTKAKPRPGAKRRVDRKELTEYVESCKDVKLTEIAERFKISEAWASIILREEGYSYKKKSFTYMESEEEEREEYIKKIKEIEAEKIVYIDESGIENAIAKDRAWSPKGKPKQAQKSGKYYKRTNIIAGYVNNKAIAPMIFTGSCNTEIFNRWIEEFLLKELEPGQYVVMDNATFHKSQKTRELIESVGCKVIFLPPYSPDLNPIEKFWANLKYWIKNHSSLFYSFYHALSSFFYIPNPN